MPHICPRCGGERTRRSKRRGIVESGPLTWLRLRPFHCGDCQCRFYVGPPYLVAILPRRLTNRLNPEFQRFDPHGSTPFGRALRPIKVTILKHLALLMHARRPPNEEQRLEKSLAQAIAKGDAE
jgi:hypothetical protein